MAGLRSQRPISQSSYSIGVYNVASFYDGTFYDHLASACLVLDHQQGDCDKRQKSRVCRKEFPIQTGDSNSGCTYITGSEGLEVYCCRPLVMSYCVAQHLRYSNSRCDPSYVPLELLYRALPPFASWFLVGNMGFVCL